MNMKRLLLILIAIAGCLGCACAASHDAAAILARMKAKINASPSLEAVFTINGGEGPVEGNAVIAGSKYTMQTPQLKVWFDGRTQWTYLLNTGEVSITEPDASEQMASNPFAIAPTPTSTKANASPTRKGAIACFSHLSEVLRA